MRIVFHYWNKTVETDTAYCVAVLVCFPRDLSTILLLPLFQLCSFSTFVVWASLSTGKPTAIIGFSLQCSSQRDVVVVQGSTT